MRELEENSFPMYGIARNVLIKREYAPTERQAQFFPLTNRTGIQDEASAFGAINEGQCVLACFGYIRYEDPIGGIRETRFFRTYRGGGPFLVPSQDADYEDS